MPIIEVKPTGAVGVNKDLSSHELPIQAWTDARNIRFLDGYAGQTYGYKEIYNPPTVKPYHVLPVNVSGTRYWVYAGTGKIYAVNGSTHTDLTRTSGGDYTGAINKWTSTLVGGIPVLNDGSGVNLPQFWNLDIAAGKFANLTNWPASTYCKSIRTYKSYLVALNITKTATNYPFMVKWSHPADPGAVPTSWDQTDATKDAGEIDLADGNDIIVDGLSLRDSFMIYKESSIWRMDYVGGIYVHRFQKVLGQGGALGVNCIEEFDGMHFVLGGNDVYVHDGNSPRSVLDKMTRRHLYANIDSTNAGNSFVVKNPYYNEIWCCYPSLGSTVPDMAMVWNYVDNTTSFREIPSIYHAKSGLMESTLTTTWADSEAWADDLTLWGQSDTTPGTARMMMASDNTKLYLSDSSASFNGTAISSYIERKGLSFDAPQKIKLVRGVRPRIVGTDGETVTIKIGSSDDAYSDPTWLSTNSFIIGTDVKVDCLVSGRYIAIRFESGSASQWRLDSYDFDVEVTGEW